jgi:hypothetical protein
MNTHFLGVLQALDNLTEGASQEILDYTEAALSRADEPEVEEEIVEDVVEEVEE